MGPLARAKGRSTVLLKERPCVGAPGVPSLLFKDQRNIKPEPSGPDLSGPANAIFERRELLHADRSARMHAACRDPDLGAEAELAAIGELRRRVVQHNRAIDLREKLVRGVLVRRDDRIRMVRTVMLDMRDRGID